MGAGSHRDGRLPRVATSSALHFVTYAEYLASEATSDVKHEWLNGMVYAMSRGSPAHSNIANMIMSILTAGFAHRDHAFRAIVTARSGPS